MAEEKPKKPFAMPPIPPLKGAPPAGSIGAVKKNEPGPAPAPLPMWSSGSPDKLAGLPMFRGAALKSNSVFGRLKNLKTKDVAFIGAGLAVLIMAPLAEYLVSESGDPASTLSPGFDQKGGVFANSADPAEMGLNQLARGGLLGENPDVITPANYRDPSSLIMAMGGEKETPAAAPEVKRDAPKDNVWDKVVSSAKSGASTAARKVGLPKPGGRLAGALNGLRSLSGGSTSAKSSNLSAPDSKGLFSSPRNENHLAGTQSVPGYRGAGSRSPAAGTGGGGGFDGRPGGFGGPGGGSAGDVMGGGIAGGGKGAGQSGGDGDPSKSPSGSSTKDNKALGESLEFLRRKMEMEKALDLKWAKKKYDELERKKLIEQTLIQTAQQAFLKVLDKLLEGKKDGEKGGGGGGSPGGGGGGEKPPAGKPEAPPDAGLPGGASARLGKPTPPAQASDSTQGEASSRETGAASTRMVGQLTSQPLSDLLPKPGTTIDDSLKPVVGALQSSIAAVDKAKEGLGKEAKNATQAVGDLKKFNQELGKNYTGADKNVAEEKKVPEAGKGLVEGLSADAPGDPPSGKKFKAASKDTAAMESAAKAVANLPDNSMQAAPTDPGIKGDAGRDQLGALQKAKADIAAAYGAMQAPEGMRAGLEANKQKALAAVDAAIQDVTVASTQLDHAGTALKTGSTLAEKAEADYNAAQAKVNANGKEATTMVSPVKSAVDAYAKEGPYKDKDGKVVDQATYDLKAPAKTAVETYTTKTTEVETALKTAKKSFGGK